MFDVVDKTPIVVLAMPSLVPPLSYVPRPLPHNPSFGSSDEFVAVLARN